MEELAWGKNPQTGNENVGHYLIIRIIHTNEVLPLPTHQTALHTHLCGVILCVTCLLFSTKCNDSSNILTWILANYVHTNACAQFNNHRDKKL